MARSRNRLPQQGFTPPAPEATEVSEAAEAVAEVEVQPEAEVVEAALEQAAEAEAPAEGEQPTEATESTEAEGEAEAEPEEEKQRSYTRWQPPQADNVSTELKRLLTEATNAENRLTGRKDVGTGPYLQNVGWYDRTVGKLEVVLTNIATEQAFAALAQLRMDAAKLTGYGTDSAQSAAGRKARDRIKAEQAASAVSATDTPPEAAQPAA